MKTIEERITELKAVYPGLTDAQLRESIEKADADKAKRKARNDKTKQELVAKGAGEPVGAKPETAKPETKPPATAPKIAPNARPTMAHADFVVRAIKNLRRPPFKGVHSVYGGINNAFMSNYGVDKAEAMRLISVVVASGVVDSRPVKGGVMLYLKGEMPESTRGDVLGQILGD
jgi:hypothetical protein